MKRSHNQDSHAILEAQDREHWEQHGNIYIVADGMGGHAVGERASEVAAHDIPHIFQKYAHDGIPKALRDAFQEANATIYAIGQENREFKGLGTTGSALVLTEQGAWIGHVGDSRIYRIRKSVIEQLSFDHSYVWEMARRAGVSPEEIEGVRSNVIVRSLGPDPQVEVDVEGPHPIHPGDVYLICSDGLSNQFKNSELGALAANLPPSEAVRLLVDLANLRGGPDNITVVLVRIADNAPVMQSKHVRNGLIGRFMSSLRDGLAEVHWPLFVLAAGPLFGLLAAVCFFNAQTQLTSVCIVLAVIALLIGLLGLFLAPPPAPRKQIDLSFIPKQLNIYSKESCEVTPEIIVNLERGQQVLAERIREKEWDTNWKSLKQRQNLAKEAAEKQDLVTAFREHCRALQILTKTVAEHRHRDEAFSPKWDRTAVESEE